MLISLFWLMLIGSVISEIAIASAFPAYRNAARNDLRVNLAGSLFIAVFWAVFTGLIGGGGGFTAALLPVVVPIATVITIPFYYIFGIYDDHKDKIPSVKRTIKTSFGVVFTVINIIFAPITVTLWIFRKTGLISVPGE